MTLLELFSHTNQLSHVFWKYDINPFNDSDLDFEKNAAIIFMRYKRLRTSLENELYVFIGRILAHEQIIINVLGDTNRTTKEKIEPFNRAVGTIQNLIVNSMDHSEVLFLSKSYPKLKEFTPITEYHT